MDVVRPVQKCVSRSKGGKTNAWTVDADDTEIQFCGGVVEVIGFKAATRKAMKEENRVPRWLATDVVAQDMVAKVVFAGDNKGMRARCEKRRVGSSMERSLVPKWRGSSCWLLLEKMWWYWFENPINLKLLTPRN